MSGTTILGWIQFDWQYLGHMHGKEPGKLSSIFQHLLKEANCTPKKTHKLWNSSDIERDSNDGWSNGWSKWMTNDYFKYQYNKRQLNE